MPGRVTGEAAGATATCGAARGEGAAACAVAGGTTLPYGGGSPCASNGDRLTPACSVASSAPCKPSLLGWRLCARGGFGGVCERAAGCAACTFSQGFVSAVSYTHLTLPTKA